MVGVHRGFWGEGLELILTDDTDLLVAPYFLLEHTHPSQFKVEP